MVPICGGGERYSTQRDQKVQRLQGILGMFGTKSKGWCGRKCGQKVAPYVSHIEDCLHKKPGGAEEQHDLICFKRTLWLLCRDQNKIGCKDGSRNISYEGTEIMQFRDNSGLYQDGSTTGEDEEQRGYI